jgi:hypothetical protein
VLDEPVQLITGPRHARAGARSVTPEGLAGHRIWMPGLVEGTEWADYYTSLAAEFGLTIDSVGPDFGMEPLLDAVANSASLATLVGEGTRLVWPAGHDLRRIPLVDPIPVYPHSLVWDAANTHPGLAALRAHLAARPPSRPASRTWTPAWAVRGVFPAGPR